MLSPTLVTEATTMFCTFLARDAPSFNPVKSLSVVSPSLKQRRDFALAALLNIGNIPEAIVVDPQATVHGVIQRNWPKILNWMKYFYNEVTSSKSDQFVVVIMTASAVVMKVARNRPLFVRAALKDDLLNLLIKVWLKTDNSPVFDDAHRFRVVAYSYEALAILDERGEQLIADAREMILREAGGEAGAMTKRMMRLLKDPATASKDCYQLVLYAVGTTAYLAIEDRIRGKPSAFMDNFLEDDLVPLITQLLSFLSEDVALPRQRQTFPEDSYSILIPHCIRILGCCARSRNGPHWAAVMLKGGILRSIACLVAFPQHLEICQGSILEIMLDHDFPQYFCHRFIVTAAIKAIKEITEDGSIKKLEASHVKDAWANFENVLLDRTVFNAIYERDFAERDILQCSNVSRIKNFRA